MPTVTKKSAAEISRLIDRIATLVEGEYEALGIPGRIAKDFAHRCDLLADRIETTGGVKRGSAGFDPSDIGREISGPLDADADEPYMRGEFSQQEKRELREEQQSGKLPAPSMEPQPARDGVQASFKGLLLALKKAKRLDEAKVVKALSLATSVVRASEKEEEPEDEPEEKEDVTDKKASHGFNLYA